jgi:hypothetical protein
MLTSFARRCIVATLALVLLGSCTHRSELKDFASDGCSLFPDGVYPSNPKMWCDCCLQHDLAYWQGGTQTERERADQALRDCVFSKTKNRGLATLMYDGVRVGGQPIFPAWYRWGYGWTYGRGYDALTESEQQQIKEKTEAYLKQHGAFTCKQ